MKHKLIKVIVSKLLIACLVFSSMNMAFGAAVTAKSDIQGHWAESQITAWIDKGWINGYPDGGFKPNSSITRAEFIALVNRSSGFSEEAPVTFSDVPSTNWAYKEVAKALKIGYINGYTDGTFKANKSISRQEVAVIVNKLLSLSATTTEATFADYGSIASWAKDAVNAAVDNKILNGYAADNTFKPLNPISRAEAVVTLDRANEPKAVVYDKAGTYGPLTGMDIVDKNVVINAPGVTLQNMTINGKLLFAAGINSGDAVLKNVTVKGDTTVQGGGVNSIHFENSSLATVTVDKAVTLGSVRIVAEGTTVVQQVIVNSPVILQEINVTGVGFGNVTISDKLPAGAEVTLRGSFDKVIVLGAGIHVILAEGSIKEFTAAATAKGLTLDLAAGTTISTLNLDAVTTVTGKGTISNAILSPAVQATGSQKFETAPGTVTVGTTPTPTTTPTTTPAPGNPGGGSPGGSPGGGGGVTPDTTAPIATVTSGTYESGQSIQAKSNEAGTVYLVLDSANITTKAAADAAVTAGNAKSVGVTANTYTSIATTHLVAGDYKAIAADGSGNLSEKSVGTIHLTSDITRPTVSLTTPKVATNAPFTVTAMFSEAVTGFNGADITVSNGTYGNFITVSTNVYQFDITPTSNGAVTIDIADSVAQDWVGNDNIAAPQLTVTYDTTVPTATVTTATYATGVAVPDAQSTETGSVYLVLASSTIATKAAADAAVSAGTAKTAIVTNSNTNTSIQTTGLTAGTYKVIAIDAAGNVSAKSLGIITITT